MSRKTQLDHIKQGFSDLQQEFTKHPTEMHQSYGRHLVESFISCGVHLGQAIKFLFHGCFPFCFPNVDVVGEVGGNPPEPPTDN